MARYAQVFDQDQSNELQVAAHQLNRYLLKPRKGMLFERISAKGQRRIERIFSWVKEFSTAEDLLVEIDAITTDLRFGVASDDFELAFDRLGKALGFDANRPDKELREGPDNLWALKDNLYWLIECKNQVDANRKEINKHETGQMNNSCAWFKKQYKGATSRNLMIIWTKTVGAAAGFTQDVQIMRSKKLELLVKKVKAFFGEPGGWIYRISLRPNFRPILNGMAFQLTRSHRTIPRRQFNSEAQRRYTRQVQPFNPISMAVRSSSELRQLSLRGARLPNPEKHLMVSLNFGIMVTLQEFALRVERVARLGLDKPW
jgi:hypothetical protein